MKGGTSNFYNKYYSIEFCPFVYLMQVSNHTETWRKQNDLYVIINSLLIF